jgi:hypothetical protein
LEIRIIAWCWTIINCWRCNTLSNSGVQLDGPIIQQAILWIIERQFSQLLDELFNIILLSMLHGLLLSFLGRWYLGVGLVCLVCCPKRSFRFTF